MQYLSGIKLLIIPDYAIETWKSSVRSVKSWHSSISSIHFFVAFDRLRIHRQGHFRMGRIAPGAGVDGKIDFRGMLDDAGLSERGSNRSYDSSKIIEAFIVSVILGTKRLAHSGTIRHDEVIRKIFCWKGGMASQITFCRYFGPTEKPSKSMLICV